MASGGTIAAIASPRGGGERGVIRVSGPEAWSVVETTWAGSGALPDPGRRGAFPGRFDDGRGTQPLLLLWMPGPRSFTREDVVEFHLPGSPFLLEAALERILTLDVRAAGPGEFTRRAFENGRIDLTRAEGILALVHARGEAERRSATALLFGGLSDRLAPLRDGLSALWSLAEASLDFDEADTGHVPADELESDAKRLLELLAEASRWEARRVDHSDLPRVVLVGAPNAGKSSLFNALVPDAQALVSEHRGTTRDVLHGLWKLPAGDLRLYDTAGLEEALAGPDQSAQRFGEGIRAGADLQLWVIDRDGLDPTELQSDAQQLAKGVPTVLVLTKVDEADLKGVVAAVRAQLRASNLLNSIQITKAVATSVLRLRGIDGLELAVTRALHLDEQSSQPASERPEREIGVRHRASLQRSARCLQSGLDAWRSGLPLDLFAESLRDACGELDAISGSTTPEDLLDRIFAAFCIGK